MGQRIYNQDAELIFKDAGAVTANAGGTVSGAAKIIKLGAGRFEAVMLIDVSAIAVAADANYNIIVQGSNTADFSGAKENLAVLNLGNTAVRPGGAATSKIGRYEVPFTTDQNDTVYDYVRIYTSVAGAAPSVNFTAWASTKY